MRTNGPCFGAFAVTDYPMIPLADYREYSVEEMRERVERFYQDMARRRTVRDFSDRPVPRDIIETALRAAGTAPSGANLQPWHFVVVSKAETKKKIREAAEAEEQEFYEHRASPEWLAALEQLYGPPPWTTSYYSQVIVNVFDKSVEEQVHIKGLPDLVLMTMHFSAARVNRLIAEEGSDFVVTQSSATYDRIRLEGQMTSFTLESWLLFAEGKNAYYVVEISYAPQSGQSLQVWEDLQTYMDSFRGVQ